MSEKTDANHRPSPTPAVQWHMLALLVAPTALGQLATNIVVPSLAAIADDLALESSLAGLIISAVLLGLGAGQLIVGPLSDRIGRRPVLLAGLAVYVGGSLAAMLAPDAELLLIARLVQGLGASSGLTLPRAIARDRYTGLHFLRVMSVLTLALSVTPGMSPILGEAVSHRFGWRASMGLSVLAGLLVLSSTLLALPESHHRRHAGNGLKAAVRSYLHVLRGRTFFAYAVGTSATFGGSYVAMAAAQDLYVDVFHWPATQMSLAAACYAGAFLLGGLLASRVMRSVQHRVVWGIAVVLTAPTLLLLSVAVGFPNSWMFLALVVMFQIGQGFLLPPGIGIALLSMDLNAGTASAVLGALQMALGAAGAALVGAIPGPIIWTMPALMLGFAVVAALAIRLAPKHVPDR